MSSIDLFIIAAEPSADVLGEKLVLALLEKAPHLQMAAVAGPKMRKLPIQPLFSMEDLQVMGFIDVALALPKIIRQFFTIRKTILKKKPKAIITIDYPGFNLRLQKSLRKKGFSGKQIHYVCPSVWAWGKKRIPLMEKNLDLLLSLFPFEAKCFEGRSLNVQHVGHPLTQAIEEPQESKRKNMLAIFPGSRTAEIEKNLPLQLQAAEKMKTLDPALEIAISISHREKQSLIEKIVKNKQCRLVPPEDHYPLMKEAKMAIATSGTVTLELALHETPTIVNYAIRPFEQFIAQKILKIDLPYYALANIIASKEIFPELFGSNLTLENLFSKTKRLWCEEDAYRLCQTNCKELRLALTKKKSSHEAASQILALLEQSPH